MFTFVLPTRGPRASACLTHPSAHPPAHPPLRWKEQREAMLSKLRDSTRAGDDEITRNLVGLAKTRPDIFGGCRGAEGPGECGAMAGRWRVRVAGESAARLLLRRPSRLPHGYTRAHPASAHASTPDSTEEELREIVTPPLHTHTYTHHPLPPKLYLSANPAP